MMDMLYNLLPWLLAGLITGRLLNYTVPRDSIPGLPVLGNVVALGRLGVSFINRIRLQFGDVFTLNLCGKGMTFLHDPALIDAFFSAPDTQITFRPAVEQFTQRVYGLPSKEFFPKHGAILTSLRHLLVPAELPTHAAKLADRVDSLSKSLFPQGQQVELYAATRSLVFRSAVEVLFGPQLFACVPGGAEQLERSFFAFEEAFELAASPVPHIFQPTFTKSRAELLTWMKKVHQSTGFESTVAGQLASRADLRPALVPNMLVAILWASQANTVPATFWSLAMLLLPENQHHLATVLEELQRELSGSSGAGGGGGSSGAGEDAAAAAAQQQRQQLSRAASKLAMDRKSAISRCVAEAIRLRSHSIDLRIVADNVELTASNGAKVRLPKGRLLAICPFESHHDPSLYPDAWKFDPNRAPFTLGDGTAVVPSIAGLAFGGGAYRCPGRFFAEMEVGLVVQLLLWQFRLSLVTAQQQQPASKSDAELHTSAGGGGDGGGDQTEPAPDALTKVLWDGLAAAAIQMLGDRAVWGLGLFERQGAMLGRDAHVGSSGTAAAGAPSDKPSSPSGGGGLVTGSRGASGAALLETWRESGDEAGLLPRCDLIRLVGLKIPREPCMVTVTAVGQHTAP